MLALPPIQACLSNDSAKYKVLTYNSKDSQLEGCHFAGTEARKV